jgi:hypothetical protein
VTPVEPTDAEGETKPRGLILLGLLAWVGAVLLLALIPLDARPGDLSGLHIAAMLLAGVLGLGGLFPIQIGLRRIFDRWMDRRG